MTGANYTIFKYALLRGLRTPVALLTMLAIPLAVILFRGMWLTPYDEIHFGGMYTLGILMMVNAFVMARGILTDRQEGTIVRILSGPTTNLRYLTQNLMACMVPIMAQILIIFGLGSILYGWGLSLTLGMMLCYTMFSLASVGLSFAWSCLFKNKEMSYSAFSVVGMLMGALGGLIMPQDWLPTWLYRAGMLFPPHWLVRGMNTLTQYGLTGWFWLSMAALALFTAAFLLFGGKRRFI